MGGDSGSHDDGAQNLGFLDSAKDVYKEAATSRSFGRDLVVG